MLTDSTVSPAAPLSSGESTLSEAARSWGSAIFSLGRRATSVVAAAAAAAVSAAEPAVNQATESAEPPAVQPPWLGLEPGARSQVLALAQDPRNFLRSPPRGCAFDAEFQLESALPSAAAALEADPALRQMRFRLVPRRLAEDQFWRNYFYRINLIQRSNQALSARPETTLATVAIEAKSCPSPASASSSVSGDSFERVPSRDKLEVDEVSNIEDDVEVVGDDWERELQLELAGVEPRNNADAGDQH